MARKAKQELEEAERLKRETEEELAKEKILEGVEVPETKPVDITKLFFEGEGLEAAAQVEQVPEEDFNVEYGRVFEDLGDESATHYVRITPVIEKIDDLINAPKYTLPQDKVSDATPSVSLPEKIMKYTKG